MARDRGHKSRVPAFRELLGIKAEGPSLPFHLSCLLPILLVITMRIFGIMSSTGMKALSVGRVLPPMRFEQAACFGPLVSITGTQKHHG